MPSIQVKDIPQDVHAVLRRRAAEAGMSLQEYLLGQLVEQARRPTLDEVLRHASGRSGGSVPFGFAAETLQRDRESH